MIVDIVNGFLGSGKTTFIQNYIKEMGNLERVVVIVNDYGEICIDGALMSLYDLDVVELPNGCICCTLSQDLTSQLIDIATKIMPDRVIIEPTGVATIQGLLSTVGSLRLEKYIEKINVILMLDAVDFPNMYSSNRHFIEDQIEKADIVLINKCDLINEDKAREIRQTVAAINDNAKVFMTSFGKVSPISHSPFHSLFENGEGNTRGPLRQNLFFHDHKHEHHFESLQNRSMEYDGIFDLEKLKLIFKKMVNCGHDRVVRAKGVFQCTDGLYRIDYVPAGGITVSRLPDNFSKHGKSRVLFIGKDLEQWLDLKEISDCLVASGKEV